MCGMLSNIQKVPSKCIPTCLSLPLLGGGVAGRGGQRGQDMGAEYGQKCPNSPGAKKPYEYLSKM